MESIRLSEMEDMSMYELIEWGIMKLEQMSEMESWKVLNEFQIDWLCERMSKLKNIKRDITKTHEQSEILVQVLMER